MRAPPNVFRHGLPLLAKELIEQAARRRTYIVRLLYAVLLQLFGFLLASDMLRGLSNNPWGVLGQGG
ncbi:MAG: hypothetical protein EHM42_07180, partial [Planctomycetaceae bacterium]